MSRPFKRRVAEAKAILDEVDRRFDRPALMWSGGKDSTALAELARGYGFRVISEKDRLDFPGEEDYVRSLAEGWSLDLTIVHPEMDPVDYLRFHGGSMEAWDDVHSRRSGLSQACFYGVVERAAKGHDCILLGLRAAESEGRAANRASRGPIYRRSSGQWVACPLADWSGWDVLAYAVSRWIELLPVYHCLGLMHTHEPWTLRKAWWVPGSAARHGGIAWLKHYWPSLHRQLCDLIPAARAY